MKRKKPVIPDNMSLEMLDEAEVKRRVARFMVDRQHWIFIPGTSRMAAKTVIKIEETFYDGEANKDFDVMMGGFGTAGHFWMGFAHKSRMSAMDLAKLIQAVNPSLSEESIKEAEAQFLSHDVIFLCLPEEASALGHAFDRWIHDAITELHDERAIQEGQITWPTMK